MRTRLIIVLPPLLDLGFCIGKGQEPVSVQALLTESTVKALDLRIVSWLARPTEVEFHSVFIRPLVHDIGDELAANIAFDRCRQATICCNTNQCINQIITLETL